MGDSLLFMMDERDRYVDVFRTMAQNPHAGAEAVKRFAHTLFPDMERMEVLAQRKSLKLLSGYLSKKFSFAKGDGSISLEVLER